MVSDQTRWKVLHPLSVVVNLVPRTWSVIKSMWPIFLILLFGGRADGQSLFDIALLSVFLMLTFGGTILHWWTLRYRVFDGRLEVQTGFFNRQTRVIAPDRIQNLETVSNVFHRLSGLVEIRIETASGTEVEGLLSALSVVEANALIETLESLRSGPVVDEREEQQSVIARNSLIDLFRYGATATRLGAALANTGIALERVGRHEEAIGYYERAIATDPPVGWTAMLYLNLGSAREAVGDYAAARAAYERSAELRPRWNSAAEALQRMASEGH